MKMLAITLGVLLCGNAIAARSVAPPVTHRYMVERTFPKGALDGLNAKAKQSVNATNARFGVNRVTSYVNADKTRTFCVYEGPDELAIRQAAAANRIPVDSITEIPTSLNPE